MTPHERTGEVSLVGRPFTHCPMCNSTDLEPVVEAVTRDVHLLCRACGRCWDVVLGSVTRVAPPSCFGCPARGRCEQVYAADHPNPESCLAPQGLPIG